MGSKEDREREQRAQRIAEQVARENSEIAAAKEEQRIADKARAEAQARIKREAEEARRRTDRGGKK